MLLVHGLLSHRLIEAFTYICCPWKRILTTPENFHCLLIFESLSLLINLIGLKYTLQLVSPWSDTFHVFDVVFIIFPFRHTKYNMDPTSITHVLLQSYNTFNVSFFLFGVVSFYIQNYVVSNITCKLILIQYANPSTLNDSNKIYHACLYPYT